MSKNVEIYNGSFLPKKEVKKIRNVYYPKDECIKFGRTWYHRSDPSLIHNDETGELEVRTPSHVNGLIVFPNGESRFGWFLMSPLSCRVRNQRLLDVNPRLNETFTEQSGVTLQCNDEIAFIRYYGQHYHLVENVYHFGAGFQAPSRRNEHPYNIDIDSFNRTLFNRFREKNPIPTIFRRYGNLLQYSVGVEYETRVGVFSDAVCQALGLAKLRDGSLGDGFEYATLPHVGGEALYYNTIIPMLLHKSHGFDEHCSLHVHLGGYPHDKFSIVVLWSLFYRVQHLIEAFLSPYRKSPQFMRDVTVPNNKVYCANLPLLNFKIKDLKNKSKEEFQQNLDIMYEKIFRFYTTGHNSDGAVNKKNARHPRQNKWNQLGRYTALNLVPLIMSRYRTVEFRQHAPTFNPEQIIAWIFFCNALLMFAQSKTSWIVKGDKVELEDIISVYLTKGTVGKEIYDFLLSYIVARISINEDYFSSHGHVQTFEEDIFMGQSRVIASSPVVEMVKSIDPSDNFITRSVIRSGAAMLRQPRTPERSGRPTRGVNFDTLGELGTNLTVTGIGGTVVGGIDNIVQTSESLTSVEPEEVASEPLPDDGDWHLDFEEDDDQ